MRNIHVERTMRATPQAVWEVLADFPNIADWNRGVKTSYATGTETQGVGATRHCDLAPTGGLEETITGWEPEQRLVVSIDSAARLPIKSAEVTFSLSETPDDEAAGTVVSIDYNYETKYGFVGRMMGGAIDRQLSSGFGVFLADLESAANSA